MWIFNLRNALQVPTAMRNLDKNTKKIRPEITDCHLKYLAHSCFFFQPFESLMEIPISCRKL